MSSNSSSLLSADLGAPESNAIQASGKPDRCPDTEALQIRLFACAPAPAPEDEAEVTVTPASATRVSDSSSVLPRAASSSSVDTSSSTAESTSGGGIPIDLAKETPGREIALVLRNQNGEVLKGKTDRAGVCTFAGLMKGCHYTLSVDAKKWAHQGAPQACKAAPSAPAEWQAALASPSTAAASRSLSVASGFRYDIQIDYLRTVDITFLNADRAPHALCDGSYTVINGVGRRRAGILKTDNAGSTTIEITLDAHGIEVQLTLPKAARRDYILIPEASGTVITARRKQERRRYYAVSFTGGSEIVDLAECAGTDNCLACAFRGGEHRCIEQVILGGYPQLGLSSNFDNDNQTGRYDVLGGLKDDTIPIKELAEARKLFTIAAPEIAWHADMEKLPPCEAGLVYVSGGRAAGLEAYLSVSPLSLWCLANGYCCDIVVDFLEYPKYCGAVKAAIAEIAKKVAEYASQHGLAPRVDDDYPVQWPTDSGPSKPGTGGSASRNKSARNPPSIPKPAAQPAVQPSSSSSSSGSGTSSTGGASTPSTALWEAHVANRLRVITTAERGLEELPRGFGFNRHVAMLWMLKRYTHVCATVDDNTLGFTANTYGMMDWLFAPGNIANAVPVGSSSSSGPRAPKGLQEKWLALALKPCTEAPSARAEPAARHTDAPATATAPVLKFCLGGKQLIQQMTVWNVAAYRTLHAGDAGMNYDVSFVTGKEDIDFHSRLLKSGAERQMFETASVALVKCKTGADEKEAAELKAKDDVITQALWDRIGKLSPCFRRLRTERDPLVYEIAKRFYDSGKFPKRPAMADLARRINKAIEQLLATGKT